MSSGCTWTRSAVGAFTLVSLSKVSPVVTARTQYGGSVHASESSVYAARCRLVDSVATSSLLTGVRAIARASLWTTASLRFCASRDAQGA
eukprot:6176565-Pleurochrysis_carterae.AAC.4